MTLIMFSLGSAVAYGAADFFGGAASRRTPVRSVLLVSLPIGLIVLTVAALVGGSAFSLDGMSWGVTGGMAGGGGLIVFYGALARGPMSVVAPVAALVSAVLPVAAGLLRGERPTPSVLIGVAICLVAICLVSLEEPRTGRSERGGEPGGRGSRAGRTGRKRLGLVVPRSARGPVLAALSGACFGIFFILLREAGHDGGMWALVASRAAGLAVVIVVGLVGWAWMRRSTRSVQYTRSGRPARSTQPAGSTSSPPASAAAVPQIVSRLVRADPAALSIAVVAGGLDSMANVLYVFATRAGMLSLAAVLTSLYPAITVLLARLVYSERLRTVQRLGVLLALLGVALVSAG
jgi:drug/metabolite transporter (DMT)-like permease